MDAKRIWLKGDTHLHTTNSDGKLTPEQLIKNCKKRGLDWIIITDHNFNTVGGESRFDGDMLIIPGEEYTGNDGHVNIWGGGCPHLTGERPTEYVQYTRLAQEAHENGCTVSVNHPFCKKCGWHMELEDYPMDCVEVWNAPMHIDNMTNLDWWHSQLLKGKRLPLVGGSDYHRDYFVTRLLANPTTFVCVKANTEEDVLTALRRGNSFVTNSPNSTKAVLSCGDAVMGDEVSLSEHTQVKLEITGIKKGMRVQVFNNDRIIYEHTAEKTGDHTAVLENLEKGFVRAQVIYDMNAPMRFLYRQIVKLWQPADAKLPIPPFAWCITNPLYLV